MKMHLNRVGVLFLICLAGCAKPNSDGAADSASPTDSRATKDCHLPKLKEFSTLCSLSVLSRYDVSKFYNALLSFENEMGAIEKDLLGLSTWKTQFRGLTEEKISCLKQNLCKEAL